MSILSPKILTSLNVAYSLVKAGMDIFALLNGKKDLTDEEVSAIIDQQNAAQKKARDELTKLLS